jgi:hypothetical protein
MSDANNNKYAIITTVFLFGTFALLFSLAGCDRGEAVVSVFPEASFEADGLTLLERAYADADGDGEDECIEVYTSAQVAADGRMAWDTGHRWALLIKKGDAVFPVVDEYLQYGELQFWVVGFGGEDADGGAGACVYVAVTNNSFELLRVYWDGKASSFRKETAFNPPNQWSVRHSKKYDAPDPGYFTSE